MLVFRQVGKDSYSSKRAALAYVERVFVSVGDRLWVARASRLADGRWIAEVAAADATDSER